jgi:hypothetical protein
MYIPISNPQGGDEDISSFSAMEKDQTPWPKDGNGKFKRGEENLC